MKKLNLKALIGAEGREEKGAVEKMVEELYDVMEAERSMPECGCYLTDTELEDGVYALARQIDLMLTVAIMDSDFSDGEYLRMLKFIWGLVEDGKYELALDVLCGLGALVNEDIPNLLNAFIYPNEQISNFMGFYCEYLIDGHIIESLFKREEVEDEGDESDCDM